MLTGVYIYYACRRERYFDAVTFDAALLFADFSPLMLRLMLPLYCCIVDVSPPAADAFFLPDAFL